MQTKFILLNIKKSDFFVFCLFLAKTERKKYEKETEKYYSSLEKLLNMSAKKKEPQLQEVFILARALCEGAVLGKVAVLVNPLFAASWSFFLHITCVVNWHYMNKTELNYSSIF
ncbi:hypothetical protein CHARACLAT_013117 [Characodon lateralis]|uniref:Uncharacterized protein n=1 Tax=Characodon lateralis TaxID=208331 RepID=A0ABU7CN62_9TELE|nr:hypothetical protein [Characodon lateralis]